MSTDDEFVRAIRERPDDLTLRLVYADWLDERGDPRGEYLRLKVRLAETTARLNQLGEQIEPTWLAAVRGPASGNEQFPLRSGRVVLLQNLRQWRTYGNVLLGVPTRERNLQILNRLVADERTQTGHEPYLIQPEQRPLDHPAVRGTPAALPDVGCVGRFRSFEPARDQEQLGSELVIIWFQDEFAFPIDPAVREQIRAIDWAQHAVDFNW